MPFPVEDFISAETLDLDCRTLYDQWMYYEIDVPQELFGVLEEIFPTFDFNSKTKLSSSPVGYLLSSVGDVFHSFHRHQSFLESGVQKHLMLYLYPSELPECLRDLVAHEELEIQKKRLHRLRISRIADQDESFFNSKNYLSS